MPRRQRPCRGPAEASPGAPALGAGQSARSRDKSHRRAGSTWRYSNPEVPVSPRKRFIALASIGVIASALVGFPSQASAQKVLCDSGGAGATGCSLSGSTGCSVSCGAGYYACCRWNVLSPPSCTCNEAR